MEKKKSMYSEHQVGNTIYQITSFFKESQESEDIVDKLRRLVLTDRERNESRKQS